MSATSIALSIIILQGLCFALMWGVLAAVGLSRRSAWQWAVAMLALAVASALIVRRDTLPLWAGWWVANVVMVSGSVALRRGIETFLRRQPADREHGLTIAAMGVVVAVTLWLDRPAATVSGASLITGYVLVRAAHAVSFGLAREFGRPLAVGCALPMWIVGGLTIVRAVAAAWQPATWGQSLNAPQGINVSVLLSIVTAMTVFNFSLTGLVVARVVARLRHLSRHDTLTGLLNRHAGVELVDAEWQRLVRYQRPFAMLSLDLDHFKAINDRHGHPVGDAVLRAFGGTLRDVIRTTDRAARVGGEEFWVLLPSTDQTGAVELAQRIRSALQAEGAVAGTDRAVTASIGVATASADEPIDKLLRRLDAALYAAKSNGRDRIEVAAPA